MMIEISYKKYIEAFIKQPIHGEKRIKGTFKNKKTGRIVEGDNFDCIVFGHGDAEECYRATIAYFNHTRREGNAEREFVSAKWDGEMIQ